MQPTLTKLVSPLLALALVLSAAGCSTAPGKRSQNPLFDTSKDPVYFSSAEEMAMGAQGAAEVRKQYKVYGDPQVAAYVDSVGQRVARVSDRNNIPYHFTVVDSSEVNAFALPGGYIYVTTGILKKMNDEAELGAVLGHEVGHVVERHALKLIQRQMVVQLGLEVLADLVGQQKADLVKIGGGLAGNLWLLRNSREAELQADEQGMKNASRAGLDPSAMLDVQDMLKSLQTSEPSAVENMLATHPAGGERIAQAKQLLPEYQGPKERNASAYREAMKGFR
jgi:predicted Zn-dependent protease